MFDWDGRWEKIRNSAVPGAQRWSAGSQLDNFIDSYSNLFFADMRLSNTEALGPPVSRRRPFQFSTFSPLKPAVTHSMPHVAAAAH